MRKIRLFIEEKNLRESLQVKVCNGDFEYLSKVMRQRIGDKIFVFNGVDGEFVAEIVMLEKKFLTIEIKEKISALKKAANVTLAFALIKNVGIDFIGQKATELGASSFQPLTTQRTIVDKINQDRLKANIKEACEQCERNDFPQILPLKKLESFLKEKDAEQKIFILCDESGQGSKASVILPKILDQEKEIVVLVGPEGGFSESEFTKMRTLKNLYPISLGPRILRADTAIISALTLVGEFISSSL